MELVGIKSRKAQYLVFIASRLESLPKIREAFDSGELSWTKAREITSVATAETEEEWLSKAEALNNRDLEKEVRRHTGRDTNGFATLTISLPVEVLAMWNDAYELVERISGTELEKWQVLEPALAELLSTHLPSEPLGESFETEDEGGLSPSVRERVLERDGWSCKAPGCSMRKNLDVHHVVFRSDSGGDEPGNLVSLCRVHHDLVHRGICRISGEAGVDLTFDRPRLVSEQEPVASSPPPAEDAVNDDDKRWRDRDIADIFDGPPAPAYEPPFEDWNDFMNHWIAQKQAREIGERARKRRGDPSGAHVCAEAGSPDSAVSDVDGSPGG